MKILMVATLCFAKGSMLMDEWLTIEDGTNDTSSLVSESATRMRMPERNKYQPIDGLIHP
jgi:hypothetical protein